MSHMIFVFHYNRGAFLQNLIRSQKEFFPKTDLVIMDDNSDDPQVIEILQQLERDYEIIQPQSHEKDHFLGGLYHNMNRALKIAAKRDVKYVIMVQEDQQFVRALDETDWQDIRAGFALKNASFVMNGSFMISEKGRRDGAKTFGHAEHNIAVPSPDLSKKYRPSRFYAFNDTGIYDLKLFEKQLGELKLSEPANEFALRERGLIMGAMQKPFFHFLPSPISYRHKGRQWRVRLVDWISKAGVHPIELKSNFVRGEGIAPPYAEDALKAPTLNEVRYWSRQGGRKNIRSQKGWRRLLTFLAPR